MEIILEHLVELDFTKVSQPIREYTHSHVRDQAPRERIQERLARPGVANAVIASVFDIDYECNRDNKPPVIELTQSEQILRSQLVAAHRRIMCRGMNGAEYSKSVGQVAQVIKQAQGYQIDNREIAQTLATCSAGGLFRPLFVAVSALR